MHFRGKVAKVMEKSWNFGPNNTMLFENWKVIKHSPWQ